MPFTIMENVLQTYYEKCRLAIGSNAAAFFLKPMKSINTLEIAIGLVILLIWIIKSISCKKKQ